MTPEQLAIAALFTAIQAGWGAIVKYLLNEIDRLRTALDKSNKSSADLIAIQNEMLKRHGLTPPSQDRQEEQT